MILTASLLLLQEPVPEIDAPQHEVVVTATTTPTEALELPWSTSLLGYEDLATSRSFSESLRALPSVMVQKTAYGQSSPYIRGLTGYHNVLLLDGVRMNHSAFRAGPNQYWSASVDPLTIEQLEVVRGPNSVLYGSDAIGGTVNAVTRSTPRGEANGGLVSSSGAYARWSSAEDSWTGRVEGFWSQNDDWSMLAGVTSRKYGDLTAGDLTGLQPGTGYDELDGDVRMDRWTDSGVHLTFAARTVRQDDVPRTHKTLDSISFNGTSTGSENHRLHDQTSDLVYARAEWEDAGGLWDRGELTASFHRTDESRDRERIKSSQLRHDIQGFTVGDFGLLARFGTDTGWDWGAEIHHEKIDSFKKEWRDGVLQAPFIQGPVADDSTVDTAALYLQREIQLEDWTVVPGVRATRARVNAGAVEDPDTGNEVSFSRSWDGVVGSLRGIRWTGEDRNVFIGLSQGFRNPSLYDLTSLDETSVVETPEFDLEPEYFLQAEVGTQGREKNLAWQLSAWQTWMNDMIIRSPEEASGSSVGKDNADGWMHGLEADVKWSLAPEWEAHLMASWMDGEVDQRVGADGVAFEDLSIVSAPVDRLMPLQAYLSARRTMNGGHFWYEGWAWAMGDADKLSFRDERDTSRIPADGTPAFTLFGLSVGWKLSKDLNLSLQIENLTDEDYRVHGSGINGSGRSIVAVLY
ncbi:MAG: TonB-dependent receptor [Planctomycetota bacterium]|jgi:hemoglobin/transferrin/lactoferrin receptor protein|nr:TonB-dependent receptor [Planctomycetota bacterium]